jgi:hypothetical protein
MNLNPTTTSSWDYFVELSDDGKQSNQQEPEIIVLPPSPPATGPSPSPGSAPDQGPQP